jgi:predicted nucleic acid-binding protein
MIQDTSFIIDVLNGNEGAVAQLELIEDERRPEKISSITVLELYEGVAQTDRPEDEQDAVLSVLDTKTILPADGNIMRQAGQISGDLITDGERIDREDCIIAATALKEGEAVVTRNEDRFGRIPHLDVVSY